MNEKKAFSEQSLYGIGMAMGATFVARFIGFIRELFVAKTFGTSATGDAFIVGFTIPDMLVAGMTFALATLYVPVYHKINENENSDHEHREFNMSVIFLISIISIAIIVLTELAPSIVIKIFASGLDNLTSRLSVQVLRIIILSTLPIMLGGITKAYSQICNRYSIITVLGVIVNSIIIFTLVLFGKSNISAVSWSVVFGYILSVLIQFTVCFKNGFVIGSNINIKSKNIKIMIIGMGPVLVSTLISEINQIIDRNFASYSITGTISALNYSSKIINLITAVIGTAISSVMFSKLSSLANQNNYKEFAEELVRINRMILVILLPIMFFLMINANEIIKLLFERGDFDSSSVKMTSGCLAFYSIGILGFNLNAIWSRAYNASFNTKIPAIGTLIAVIINTTLNFILMPIMSYRGLALATALSTISSSIFLICYYAKINPLFNVFFMIKSVYTIFLASTIYVLGFFATRVLVNGSILKLFVYKASIFFTLTVIYFLILYNIDKKIASSFHNYLAAHLK